MKTQASRSLSAQSRSRIRHSKDTEIASNMIKLDTLNFRTH